jgi:hypothetical protein
VEEHCVCYIFIMPSKRLNHSDTFCYVWGEKTLKSQRRNFTLLIINFMSLILGVKFVTKIKVEPLIFTSHKMGKWFAPLAIDCSHGLDRTRKPSPDCYFCLMKHNRDHLKIPHTQ